MEISLRSLTTRTAVSTASCVALSAVLTMNSASVAHADYFSGGMPNRSFKIQAVAVNSTWMNHLRNATNNWNSAGVGASIKYNVPSKSTFTAGPYFRSWYGLYTGYDSRGPKRYFEITVNSKKLSEDAGSKLSAWSLSTSTHEIGHALSLSDNPKTTKASLMKHSRDRAKIQKPQAYDKAEVTRIYK